MWGCINGWERHSLSKSEQCVRASWSPAVLCDTRREFQPIRVTEIVLHQAPDSYTCSLKVFCVSTKRELTHFYLALLQKITYFVHFENKIYMGIYIFYMVIGDKDFAFNLVVIAHDHA